MDDEDGGGVLVVWLIVGAALALVVWIMAAVGFASLWR